MKNNTDEFEGLADIVDDSTYVILNISDEKEVDMNKMRQWIDEQKPQEIYISQEQAKKYPFITSLGTLKFYNGIPVKIFGGMHRSIYKKVEDR